MTDLKFTPTHEWLQADSDDTVIVGITDHAQQLLGDMVFVELPVLNRMVNAGDELGVVESVKAASDFYAPISGVVIAINDTVSRDPGLVNSDPQGSGWLVKIRLTKPEELAHLLTPQQYDHVLAKDN